MTSLPEMREREIHVWIAFNDQGRRNVLIEAREPKAVRALLRDPRAHIARQGPCYALAEWRGGAIPWKAWFPSHYRGKGPEDALSESPGEHK